MYGGERPGEQMGKKGVGNGQKEDGQWARGGVSSDMGMEEVVHGD